MKNAEVINLIAPCGTHCGLCECYKAKDDSGLMEYLLSRGFKKESLPCPGCRALKGNCPAIIGACETYTCMTNHNIEFCYECQEFPCAKLNPAADRANILPHNIKIFNLSFIKNQGIEKFLEKAAEIRERYYKGKMAIGKGPQI